MLPGSGEGVEYLLHVMLLLETIDERQHLGRPFSGQLGQNGADVLVLGRERSDASRLVRPLQLAEVAKGAANDQLRFALLAAALAHLFQAMIDQVQLEVVLVQSLWVQTEHSYLGEHKTDTAVGGKMPAVLGDDVANRA